jgi:transcriptional regulator GlxA family with amidase domain
MNTPSGAAQPQPSNPRNVAILIFDDIEVLDFAGPYEVFNVASEVTKPTPFYVYNIGLKPGPAQARGRFMVQPQYTIEDCPQPDILIIPGGFGTRPLIKHERLIGWIAAQAQRVELLLSVCTGALLLAKAGVLAGCPATTHHESLAHLAALSPTTQVVSDQRFVQSAPHIITSGGITAGIDMALYVVKTLCGPEAHAAVVAEMEYQWFMPRGS